MPDSIFGKDRWSPILKAFATDSVFGRDRWQHQYHFVVPANERLNAVKFRDFPPIRLRH